MFKREKNIVAWLNRKLTKELNEYPIIISLQGVLIILLLIELIRCLI